MANEVAPIVTGILAALGGFTLLHWIGFSLIVKLGLAAATLVGVIAIVRVSQGQSLDSAAGDFKSSANRAAGNLKANINQAQHKMS